MAKSKYTEETVQVICDAIAATGNDYAGFQSAKVSKPTFYSWLKDYPDFLNRVQAARAKFRETCPEVMIAQGRAALADHLYGRVVKTSVKKKYSVDGDGNEYLSEIERNEINVGPAQWAIERVLGSAEKIDELQALQALINAGWLPDEILEVASGEFEQLRSRLKEAFKGAATGEGPSQGG